MSEIMLVLSVISIHNLFIMSKRDQTNDIHLSSIHLERFDCTMIRAVNSAFLPD